MTDAWLGFVATMLGAVVGGLISAAGQYLVIREARSAKAAEDKSKREFFARSLLFKIIEIYSDSTQ